MESRFRPTLWPGTVVPTPALVPFREVAVKDDWIIWPVAASAGQPKVQLPEDFYLREMLELKPGDLGAVASLMGSYGLLVDLDLEDLDLSDCEPGEQRKLLSLSDYPENPASFEEAHGGIHRDVVSLAVNAAQRATRTFLACQFDGGLEELVEPNINKEYLSGLQELNAHNPEPWPRSLDHLRQVLTSMIQGAGGAGY